MVCIQQWIRTLAAAAVLFAGTCAVADAQTTPLATPSPSPNQLFLRTFARMQSYPVPAYVISIDSWHVRSLGKDYVYRWRYATRTADGTMNAARYPIDGRGLPANANIGPEILVRSAWIVMTRASRQRTSRKLAANAELPNMKVIASVVAYRPDYAIDMVGIESVSGHPSYHLRLRPYGDPVKHNLQRPHGSRRVGRLIFGRRATMGSAVRAALRTTSPSRSSPPPARGS